MSIISSEQLIRFEQLRIKLFKIIEKEVNSTDAGFKSAEGHIDIGFPNYFEDNNGTKGPYYINLYCYVCSGGDGGRHHLFEGTFDECLNQLEDYIEFSEKEYEYMMERIKNNPGLYPLDICKQK